MSVYRRVPMPDDVTALPKLGDMPVPWITEYRVDGEDPKYLNHAATDGLAIDCTCRLGAGRPQVGKQCVRRQRAAMRHRRCNVCGKHIPGTAIFVGVAAMGSPDRVSSIEAPSHPACAAYSALTCPRLVGSPGQCRVAVIAGEYVIFDRWAVANDETTVVANGQPRRQFRGRWVGGAGPARHRAALVQCGDVGRVDDHQRAARVSGAVGQAGHVGMRLPGPPSLYAFRRLTAAERAVHAR